MKRPSFRKCVDQHCRDCIYDEMQPGTWRKQVQECTSLNCALFSVRPLPIATTLPVKVGSFNSGSESGRKSMIVDQIIREDENSNNRSDVI